MLNMSDFDAPKVLQLTVNFRSHNQILTLANSVISAIELFFPLTIDKLIKERSDIDGLKPIVLDSSLLDSLFYVLLGKSSTTEKKGLLQG
jgi:superfamily I DNA/RNA helicase